MLIVAPASVKLLTLLLILPLLLQLIDNFVSEGAVKLLLEEPHLKQKAQELCSSACQRYETRSLVQLLVRAKEQLCVKCDESYMTSA